MRISTAQIFALPIIPAALLFSGCVATQVINPWTNPSYTTASFKRIMVIGVSKQSAIRRRCQGFFSAIYGDRWQKDV